MGRQTTGLFDFIFQSEQFTVEVAEGKDGTQMKQKTQNRIGQAHYRRALTELETRYGVSLELVARDDEAYKDAVKKIGNVLETLASIGSSSLDLYVTAEHYTFSIRSDIEETDPDKLFEDE